MTRLALSLLAMTIGCSGSAPMGSTTPPIGEPARLEPGAPLAAQSTGVQAVASASAEAASEQDAYDAAVAALHARLLGDGVALPIPVHDRTRDGTHVERGASGFVARVWLDEARTRAILESIVSTPPPALPPPFDRPVAALHRAHLERLSCERRLALLGDACTPPDTTALEAEVRALASTLRLRSRWDGGVPVGADGAPLRPPAVVLERVLPDGSASPVSGFPLVATYDGATQSVSTDETGTATFADAVAEALPAGVTVALDREGLAGPLASQWPELSTRIRGRPIDLRRWAVATAERVAGRAARQRVFARALGPVMTELGARRAASLPEGSVDRIAALPAAQRGAAIAALADELGGRVDVVLVAEVDSEFASSMGPSRVWFEARGRLEAIDVWTGRTLHAVTSSVTAQGVGEARADEAARAELARTLARELAQHPGLLPRTEPIASR